MKLPDFIKSVSPLDISLFILFVIYLVIPVKTPPFMAPYIESPLGMVFMFCVTVFLFLYANPILAILYIFVAYELLRRSANVGASIRSQTAYLQPTPSQAQRDAEMQEMNPSPNQHSLEEEVVHQMAPIAKSEPSIYTTSTFKPVADNVFGASMI